MAEVVRLLEAAPVRRGLRRVVVGGAMQEEKELKKHFSGASIRILMMRGEEPNLDLKKYGDGSRHAVRRPTLVVRPGDRLPVR